MRDTCWNKIKFGFVSDFVWIFSFLLWLGSGSLVVVYMFNVEQDVYKLELNDVKDEAMVCDISISIFTF